MDVIKAIKELRDQKARLDEVIAHLEGLSLKHGGQAASRPVRGRRGRKHMDPEERVQVSARMKAYWARRRMSAAKAAKASASGGD